MNRIIELVNELSHGNQVIAGAISLWGLGVASYIFKSLPGRIYDFCSKHLTSQITIHNTDDVYQDISKVFVKRGLLKKMRKIRLDSTKDDSEKVGEGNHFIFDGWRPLFINVQKEDASATYMHKESMSIRIFGRSFSYFQQILSDCRKGSVDGLVIKKSGSYGLEKIGVFPYRKLDSIFMDQDNKNLLIKSINDFFKRREWYERNGVPYQYGILLHGPPGTGKTSIAKALASHFKSELIIQDFNKLSSFESSLVKAKTRSIFVIEDIDCHKSASSRDHEDEEVDSPEVSLSYLLNTLDGPYSGGGKVVIMTTNHIDKLDPALVRPGRCDLTIEIGFVTNQVFADFCRKFFPDKSLPENFAVKDNVTVAQLQNEILQNKTFEEIVNEFGSN